MERIDPAETGFSPRRLAQVETVAKRYVDSGEVAGVIVGIARRGRLAYLDSWGSRDLAAARPMTRDTLVRIYSMTKPITSAATMLLCERAQIRLTDSIARYFPSFEEMEVYLGGTEPPFRTSPAEREIRIQDLLTHTAGLAYGIGDEHPVEQEFERAVWGKVAREPDVSLQSMTEAIAELPLVHQPRTAWRYSVAIDVLGALVEKVDGRPFARFLSEELFEPLGMHDTWFTVPESERERLAVVYTPGEDGLEPSEDPPVMAYTDPRRPASGGGGLVSTVDDYLRFAQMLLNGGRAGDRWLLSPRTVDLMMTDHLPPDVEGWDRPGSGFGLGGQVVTDPVQWTDYGSPGRFSWGGAASTLFWVDPAEELAAVFMLQLVPGFSSRITDDLYASVYQAIVE